MPTSKLYRAFPELDPFDDDRCIRFVRAAQGKWWRRTIRWISLVFFAVVLWGVIALGLLELATWLLRSGPHPDNSFGPVPLILGQALCLGAALLASGLASLVVRDVFLRRSVRRVLKGSSDCWNCGYRLLGLPVSADSSIRCPECGSVSRVDASLTELSDRPAAVDGSTELIADRPAKIHWWRRVNVRRRVIACSIVLLLLPLGWEAFIQWQAAKARRLNPGAKGLMQHVLDAQRITSAESDAWSIAVAAAMSLQEAEANVRGEHGGAWPRFKVSDEERKLFDEQGAGPGMAGWLMSDPEMYPEYGSMIGPARGTVGIEARYYTEGGQIARKVLASEHIRETFERLRRLRVGPDGIVAVGGMRAINASKDFPAAGILLPELGPLGRLGRMQAGRAMLAASLGEVDEAIAVIEESLVIAQVVGDQALQFDRQVASAVQNGALRAVGALLDGPLTPAQLDRLDQLVRERTIRTDIAHAIEGERLFAVSNVCWVFSNPNRARFGLLSPAFVEFAGTWAGSMFGYEDMLEAWPKQDLGSLDRNLRYVNAIYAHHLAQAAFPPAKRGVLPPGLKSEAERLYLSQLFTSNFYWLFMNWDYEQQQLAGMRVRLALEQHKMRNGAYPESLDEVADALGGPLLDPMSGQTMLYKRIDPASDEFGLHYLLYVPGPDGTDNGGVRATPPKDRAGPVPWRELPSGADFIMNDPER